MSNDPEGQQPTAPGKAEAVPSPLGWSMHCPWCERGFVAMPSPGKVPAPPDLAAELQECMENAARYEWLRKYRDVLLLTGLFGNGTDRRIEDADAAIDALRRKGGAA